MLRYLLFILAMLCLAHTNCQTSVTPVVESSNPVHLIAYSGVRASQSGTGNRNGLNTGVELHTLIKTTARFRIDLGFGVGYLSIPLRGGRYSDVVFRTSFGVNVQNRVSGGILLSYAAIEGTASSEVYLATTVPLSTRISFYGRGTFGVGVDPESVTNYLVYGGQLGMSYNLSR